MRNPLPDSIIMVLHGGKMKKKINLISFAVFLCMVIFFTGISFASFPAKPKKSDKCPVCGMFVSPYPNWITEIIFKDGTVAFFDGPKDMLKYYFDMPKYTKEKLKDDISEIYVTEYYTTALRKVREVYFITGSDVKGPMGEELVPVMGEAPAKTFIHDHGGKKMLKFDEITPGDIPGGMMHRHGK
jgi:nitrous oxide reductase accessory protein NosL